MESVHSGYIMIRKAAGRIFPAVFLFISILLFSCCVSAGPVVLSEYVQLSGECPLYDSPDVVEPFAVMRDGEVAEVLSRENGLCRLLCAGTEGYADDLPSAMIPLSGSDGALQSGCVLYPSLRDAVDGSVEGPVPAELPAGTSVLVFASRDGFSFLSDGCSAGWVESAHLVPDGLEYTGTYFDVYSSRQSYNVDSCLSGDMKACAEGVWDAVRTGTSDTVTAGFYTLGDTEAEIVDSLEQVCMALNADYYFTTGLTEGTGLTKLSFPSEEGRQDGYDISFSEPEEKIPVYVDVAGMRAALSTWQTYIDACRIMVSAGIRDGMSEEETVSAIILAICGYMEPGDADGLGDALMSGTGDCKYYSDIFRAACFAYGIQCRAVYGYGSSRCANGEYIFDPSEDGHVWNCVLVDGLWKYTDVIWTDSSLSGPGIAGGYESSPYFLSEELWPDHKVVPLSEIVLNTAFL